MLCCAVLFEDITKRSQKVSRKEAEIRKSSKVGGCSENIVELEWVITSIPPQCINLKVLTAIPQFK